MIRFIDMFCGIGGFRLGLEKSGRDREVANTKGLQPRGGKPDSANACEWTSSALNCVWSNDNDKYACQIYRKHWGEICEGDIRAIDASAVPEHDLLCAGFPCQSFSIAGKRRGFEDTRGTLFFEICRVLRAKRPGYLLLENVRGLLSHDLGRTFEVILSSLSELGYDCQWQVLNSKDFGVPQNRERVFVVGHTRGKPRPQVFPLGEIDEGIIEASETSPEERTGFRGDIASVDTRTGSTARGQHLIVDANARLSEISGALPSNYFKGTEGEGHHGSRPMVIVHENKSGQRTPHKEAQALRSATSHNYQTVNRIRRLTPLECERLQGFPDGWTEGISDTQRYKCLGNAVTVNVIEAIGKQFLLALDRNRQGGMGI